MIDLYTPPVPYGNFAFFKAAAALLVYIGAVTFTNRFPYFHDNPMMFSLFGVPLFSYIIYQLLVCTQKRVLRICRTKVVLWAGNISFAFYIAQILSRPLTRILYGYTLEEYVTNFPTSAVWCCILLNTLLATLLHFAIEIPCKNWLLRRRKAKQARLAENE
ncbi:MAG: hypothetical protein HFK04_00785 [Oscillospiraceae bacterium]|nr:hypothetical protein [Oscillospiraceae bacterium]